MNQKLKLAYEKNLPQIPPAIDEDIRNFLKEKELLFDMVSAYGSPLNVMFPERVAKNINSFQDVYQRNNLSGKVFYCTKPNKSLAVKKRASLEDVYADISSTGALHEILKAGFNPQRLEATGPKNPEYLGLAIQLGVIINADSLEELQQALVIRRSLKMREKTRIFVRLAGFYSKTTKFTKQDGTFGVPVCDISSVYEFLDQHQEQFDFLGFSYYVSGATDLQRNICLQQCIQLTLDAYKRGLRPQGINIGGGFHVQYADTKADWDAYTDEIKRSVIEDETAQMTWNDSGLGYRKQGGLLTGAANYMDHYTGSFAAADFEKTITQPLPELRNESAASILSDAMLDLYIEPGRSLLDQVGITIGRVNLVKKSTLGESLVLLDMNRSNMHATHQKLLTEPVIVYKNRAKCQPCKDGVYYVGNLCVSYDIIQYNKTFPSHLPEPGDLVAFINTAPYIMDFIESNTLHQKTARKIAVTHDGQRFRSFDDTEYNPIKIDLERSFT